MSGRKREARDLGVTSLPARTANPARFASAVVGAVVFFTIVHFSGVITGRETFFFRDISTTELPADAIRASIGMSPINPYASFGQPFAPNPNLVLWHRAALSFLSVSQHILLHLLFGAVGAFVMMRRRGTSIAGSLLTALTYSASGYVISSASFLNALTTLAWAPWAVTFAQDRSAHWKHWVAGTVTLAIFTLTGEPVLIACFLAVMVWVALTRRNFRWFGALLAAVVLTLPAHYATYRAAIDSARVQAGFSFEQATSQALHPWRFLETLVPGLFGDPLHLQAGAWWGFALSSNAAPYVYSLALGITPVLIASGYGIQTRFRASQEWWLILAVSVVAAMPQVIPGAAFVYAQLPFLHVVRYPVKWFAVTTFALSLLAGEGFDNALAGEKRPGRYVTALLAVAGLSTVGALAQLAAPERVQALLVSAWWDLRWAARPDVVLTPITARIWWRLALLAFSSVAVARLHARRSAIAAFAVFLAVTIDLIPAAVPLLPTVPLDVYAGQPSPLVTAAKTLHGPIFERAGRDLEPVRLGLFGTYADDTIRSLATAQSRQAWALTGALHGLKYAFDNSPDASYSYRDTLAYSSLAAIRDWTIRVRWLRADGVEGIITPNLPNGLPGLRELARDDTGIPETLFRIEGPLPTIRFARSPRAVRTLSEALATMHEADLENADGVVVETSSPPPRVPSRGRVRDIVETPTDVRLVSETDTGGIVFIARTFTHTAHATINGRAALVLPANINLIALQVPPGTSQIHLFLGHETDV